MCIYIYVLNPYCKTYSVRDSKFMCSHTSNEKMHRQLYFYNINCIIIIYYNNTILLNKLYIYIYINIYILRTSVTRVTSTYHYTHTHTRVRYGYVTAMT